MSSRNKRTLVVAAIVALILLSVAAVAYWTTTGSGEGSSQVGIVIPVALHASFLPGIAPGGTRQVSFTADNPNADSVRVRTVVLVNVDADPRHPGCDTTDFQMDDVVENQDIPGNTNGVALANKGTLRYVNTNTSQDPCKGATITLTVKSD